MYLGKLIEANLEHETRIFPFIPHWRIPSFIRSLSAICVLEREFQIKLHISTLPLEILSCGTCLIVSSEIARKLPFSERLIHDINALIVRDPRNHSELEIVLQQVIEDQELSHRIGSQGALLMKHMQDHEACVNRHEHMLNQALSNVPQAHYLLGNSYKGEQPYQRMLWRYFPLTSKILDSHIETVKERLKSISESQRRENFYQGAIEFCEAVASVFEQERTLPDYLADIMLWELYRVPNDSEDLVQIAEDMLFRSKQIDGREIFIDDFTAIPIRLENVFMRGFSYDMEMLSRQIEEYGLPKPIMGRKAAFFYLFKYLPGRPQVPVLRVDPEISLLLNLCDGCRTIKDIASILVDSDLVEEPLPLKEVEILCARRLVHLFSEGLIRFEKIKRNYVSN